MNTAIPITTLPNRSHHNKPCQSSSTPLNYRLTMREQDVLALLACGLQNKEIARVLTITPNTVAGYLKDIYRKLGVNNRTAASYIAIDLGLLKEKANNVAALVFA